MIFVLNTPILTDWGEYVFSRISLEEVKSLLQRGFISAVGHEGTASLMSRLTGISITANRIAVKMQVGDQAVVFRVLTRLPEGKILTSEELQTIPYEFGLLRKVQ
jgi:hypothetical protein